SDVWSHKQLLKVVSHTPVEVERMARAKAAHGWIDVARELAPEPEKLFTWWSYRARDWRASNRGRRLDHIWVSPALKKAALSGGRAAFNIHDDARDWTKPSDHAPVSLILDL
ncbi:MAG: endonuclease/exonuclease/phosphatase family protein, partial [Pseudomonadota bacterium]